MSYTVAQVIHGILKRQKTVGFSNGFISLFYSIQLIHKAQTYHNANKCSNSIKAKRIILYKHKEEINIIERYSQTTSTQFSCSQLTLLALIIEIEEGFFAQSTKCLANSKVSQDLDLVVVIVQVSHFLPSLSARSTISVGVTGVNFQYQLTEDDLQKVFARYGHVRGIDIFQDGVLAYVHFSNPETAQSAINDLNGKILEVLNGCEGRLVVKWCETNGIRKKYTCRIDVGMQNVTLPNGKTFHVRIRT